MANGHMRINHRIFGSNVHQSVRIVCLRDSVEVKLPCPSLCISVDDTVIFEIAIENAFSFLDCENLARSMTYIQHSTLCSLTDACKSVSCSKAASL